MREVSSEKVRVNLRDILQKYSKDEIATICTEVVSKLTDKADELGQLFRTLQEAYPEIFGLVDFSLICTFTADAYPAGEAPFLCMLGTQDGIARAATNIIAGLREISNGHDKTTA